ncbi:MAG TPA: hypothetical protein VEF33_14950, partial [Syntrophales bacterium]|nr:hypothetical protein [Syntrophales bacterium]
MQYHSIIKKIHTYVGMVLAPFILLEAITGLILVEPWLIGDELSDSSLTLLNTIEMLHQGEIINLNFPW